MPDYGTIHIYIHLLEFFSTKSNLQLYDETGRPNFDLTKQGLKKIIVTVVNLLNILANVYFRIFISGFSVNLGYGILKLILGY